MVFQVWELLILGILGKRLPNQVIADNCWVSLLGICGIGSIKSLSVDLLEPILIAYDLQLRSRKLC